MGKFDELSDAELEAERERRIKAAKAKKRGHRDEVIILRGRHAQRYLHGDADDDTENEESEDSDEEDDDDEEETKSEESESTKPPRKVSGSTKKAGTKPRNFSYFKG